MKKIEKDYKKKRIIFWIILIIILSIVIISVPITFKRGSALIVAGLIIILLNYLQLQYPILNKETKLNIFGAMGICSIITGIIFSIIFFFLPYNLITLIIIIFSLILGSFLIYYNYKFINKKFKK